ncbi:hypothetical protein [Nocardioides montaniterrae]
MSSTARAIRIEVAEGEHQPHLSHDLPCLVCGHAPHFYLPCDHGCGCPGTR